MKYDLRTERKKRDIISQYVRENIPGLSKAYYLKLEKQDDVDATIVYTLHKYCGFPLPDDFYKYGVPSVRLNCYMKDINTYDFFNIFAEKTGTSFHWIKRKWIEDKYISLYDYKDAIDEILGDMCVPCCITEDTVKFCGEPDTVFPVTGTLFYCWRLYDGDKVVKEGIIAAKSKESAKKKLDAWHLCSMDEFFHIYASTKEIADDIGVLEEDGIELLNPCTMYHSHDSTYYPNLYEYDAEMVKMNCYLVGMKATKFFNTFAEKAKVTLYWIKKKYWLEDTDVSLAEYKDIIDEIFGEIYIPCVYEGDKVKPLNKDVVIPVLKNKFFGWKLCDAQTNMVLKQGIIVAKSEKTALNKLNKWYLCKEDESFVVDCTTKELDADVGVF